MDVDNKNDYMSKIFGLIDSIIIGYQIFKEADTKQFVISQQRRGNVESDNISLSIAEKLYEYATKYYNKDQNTIIIKTGVMYMGTQ